MFTLSFSPWGQRIDLSLAIAVFALLVSILSAYFTKTQSDSARKELKLHEKEVDSSISRFFIGEKRKHYERLIEESMQFWDYYPSLQGEAITLKSSARNTDPFGQQKTNIPPYFEQGKVHLKAYKEIWKRYDDAPSICQKKEKEEKALKDI